MQSIGQRAKGKAAIGLVRFTLLEVSGTGDFTLIRAAWNTRLARIPDKPQDPIEASILAPE
jgi:hypothetical protein